jgi:hypothetical protein
LYLKLTCPEFTFSWVIGVGISEVGLAETYEDGSLSISATNSSADIVSVRG